MSSHKPLSVYRDVLYRQFENMLFSLSLSAVLVNCSVQPGCLKYPSLQVKYSFKKSLKKGKIISAITRLSPPHFPINSIFFVFCFQYFPSLPLALAASSRIHIFNSVNVFFTKILVIIGCGRPVPPLRRRSIGCRWLWPAPPLSPPPRLAPADAGAPLARGLSPSPRTPPLPLSPRSLAPGAGKGAAASPGAQGEEGAEGG